MTSADILTIVVTAIGLILVPMLGLLIRGMVKWVRTEEQLSLLIRQVKQLVDDKERTHSDILSQMKFDRDATNKRLRFLEEYFMSHGMGRNPR